MPEIKKYIFENGVMKINPAYKAQQGQASTVAVPDKVLATVSSTDDIMQASQAHIEATGEPMHLAESTTASMEIMQDGEFLDQFHSPQKIDGGELLDKLGQVFAKYEVPIGLVNKLLALQGYKLNFIIDDSGSMKSSSDVFLNQASDYVKANSGGSRFMTRWQEAQDRLHIMIDLLAYIPTHEATINFLNRGNKIVLNRQGKTPEQFARDAHEQIKNAFAQDPDGGTPIFDRLTKAFKQGNQSTLPTMQYLFTDGVPDGGGPADIARIRDLVIRRDADKNPLTFMSCTDQDQETGWMKAIDEDNRTKNVAEVDDFEDEKNEVLAKQGPAMPFSKGTWLLCQLVAAIDHDLDAIDESKPCTKKTMNDLMGRKLNDQEYKYYFDNNPSAQKFYANLYDQFKREDIVASALPDLHLKNNQAPMYGSMWFKPSQEPSYDSISVSNVLNSPRF